MGCGFGKIRSFSEFVFPHLQVLELGLEQEPEPEQALAQGREPELEPELEAELEQEVQLELETEPLAFRESWNHSVVRYSRMSNRCESPCLMDAQG